MLKVNYFVTSDLSGHLSPLEGEKKSLSICKKKKVKEMQNLER